MIRSASQREGRDTAGKPRRRSRPSKVRDLVTSPRPPRPAAVLNPRLATLNLPGGQFGSSQVPAGWRKLLKLIPNYDPFRDAAGCYFDADEAKKWIGFFHDWLTHVEGKLKRQRFILELWQQAVVANLAGWKKVDTRTRRYRELLLYIARKNGKTPFAAGIALCVFFCDNEGGQQDEIAASTREQAGKLFRYCQGMIEAEPELRNRCRVYQTQSAGGAGVRSIVHNDDPLSALKVISADAPGQHGGTLHLGMCDELHAQPNRDLVDVMQTSTASENRQQPLCVWLTTADIDRPSICNEKYDYARQVCEGTIPDRAFLPVVYECKPPRASGGEGESTEELWWTDEQRWRDANPNLRVSVSLDYMRRECDRAIRVIAYRNTFLRLHLNIRTGQAEHAVPLEQWDACGREIDWDEFDGQPCVAALDLGATRDFVALVQGFPHDDAETIEVATPEDEEQKITLVRRSYTIRCHFWLPEHPRERDPRMAAQLDAWSQEGLIERTPGEVVDYDLVIERVKQINAVNPILAMPVDVAFEGYHVVNKLMEFFGDTSKPEDQQTQQTVCVVKQGIVPMTAPTREFLELITLGRLHHDGHPVMRWMVGNIALEQRGGAMKISKDKSTEKVDGPVAAVMLIARAMAPLVASGSVYDTPGQLSL